MKPKFTIEQIAQICHEVNRAYCESIGDNSQEPWAEAPDWKKTAARNGVEFYVSSVALGQEPSPSKSHEDWMENKLTAGWSWGSEKSAEHKSDAEQCAELLAARNRIWRRERGELWMANGTT